MVTRASTLRLGILYINIYSPTNGSNTKKHSDANTSIKIGCRNNVSYTSSKDDCSVLNADSGR